jgi:Flp pilus assembly protein TadD
MKHDRGWGFRGALVAAVTGFCAFSGAAQAQSAAATESPGAALRRQVAELAANPTSVGELVATGRAAMAVGDAEGALGFFTRARDLAPRDARVAAGLASANARMGKPETALVLFTEAASLGAPETELAADRGLAYDLLGQTARAQQDYLLALRHREDAEVRRRLAVSLAISGQREAALRLVDEQVRQGDRAAQRARIMVLALSGDTRGATAAAQADLPAQASQAITPFLTRLASLSPGDQASAANLGRVPGSARQAQATRTATADPAALAFAGGGAPATRSLSNRLPIAPVSLDAPRRRPGGVTQVASSTPARTGEPSRVLASSSMLVRRVMPQAPAPSGLDLPHPHQPLRLLNGSASAVTTAETGELSAPSDAAPTRLAVSTAANDALAGGAGGPAAADETPRVDLAALQPPVSAPVAERQPEPEPASAPAPQAVDGAAANLSVWNGGAAPATPAPAAVRPRARSAPPSTTATATPTRQNRRAFSDVVAAVSSLPAEPTPSSTSRTATRRTPRAAPTPTPSRAATQDRTARTAAAAARTATPRQAQPSRVWVQLGVSPNLTGFNYEISRMRQAAPELRTQTAHTAPIGSGSHRLLVGPFPNEAAARTLINSLRQKNISSMTWTSPAGTQVNRFTGR